MKTLNGHVVAPLFFFFFSFPPNRNPRLLTFDAMLDLYWILGYIASIQRTRAVESAILVGRSYGRMQRRGKKIKNKNKNPQNSPKKGKPE